jgi:hypothetical protein
VVSPAIFPTSVRAGVGHLWATRKNRMKNLLTMLLTIPLMALHLSASDVRIVGTVHVDIQPVHDWLENPTGDRPMAHWKEIKIIEFTPGAPWPTSKFTADGKTKTAYLKNIPPVTIQYLNQINQLRAQIKNLKNQITNDRKQLHSADAVQAESGSQYDQNRDAFRARLHNNEIDLDSLNEKLEELDSQEKEKTSDFAMFTGQIYNKLEVWDCGQKTFR